jgi:hypothetical protein
MLETYLNFILYVDMTVTPSSKRLWRMIDEMFFQFMLSVKKVVASKVAQIPVTDLHVVIWTTFVMDL